MTFANATKLIDRLAVGIVYTAVVVAMPLAAYSFFAQSF